MSVFNLKDHTIFITGAAGHLGAAMCRYLAQQQAHLLINGRNVEKLEALKDVLLKDGAASVEIHAFDVGDEAQMNAAIEKISSTHDKIDHLVFNANHGVAGSLDKITWEQSTISAEQNITSPMMTTIKFLPLLEKSDHASIVNIGSMYGMVSPDPGIYGDSGANNPAFYGAAKAGLIQLTRYLACHLAEKNIRVNSISPGPFPPQSLKQDDPEFHQKLANKVPMKRIGKAEEIPPCLHFLLSEASTYVTGVNIPIDGGWTAW